MTDNQAERFKKLADENNWLRASLANSGGPCPYCALPKAEWSACANGFPGCPRGDDAMLCPNVGASLEAEDRIKELEAQLETARMRLTACDVVAMADTPDSAAKARAMHPDYRSPALESVVDECIALRRALHEIAEEWAGSECGVPVYAQEAYAIRVAKRMYELAVEGLKGQS